MHCRRCGAGLVEGADFCTQCGAPAALPETAQATTVRVPDAPAGPPPGAPVAEAGRRPRHRGRRALVVAVVLAALAAAFAGGFVARDLMEDEPTPPAAVTAALAPATGDVAATAPASSLSTTIAPALPRPVAIVRIRDGSFAPTTLELDVDVTPGVRWINDDDRSYTIVSRARGDDGERLFESPSVPPGGTWSFDFSTLDRAFHRYFISLDGRTVPGMVDAG